MGLPYRTELRRSELDRKKRILEITTEHVRFDGEEVSCAGVDAVRYGSVLMQGGMGKFGEVEIFELRLRERNGKTLRVTFTASFGRKKKEGLRTLFYDVLDALSEALTARLIAGMAAALESGEPFAVGRVRFAGGMVTVPGGFLRKAKSCPLDELAWSADGGFLVLRHTGGGPLARLRLLGIWNAALLAEVLAIRDGDTIP